jgi:tripartite ATP-independent transporter DctP family solute receptor
MVSTEMRALREEFAATSRVAPVRFQGGIKMRLFAILSAAMVGGSLLVGAASAQEERTIRWGHLNNTDHPVSAGVQKFAEILLAKSGGKLKIREFASSQLGNELQQQSALRGGTQEMFSASTTSLATVVPEFGLLDFPFIVSTTDQADALVGGAYGKAMMDTLPQRGLVALGYWGLGFRNVTNSKHPITKLEDFAGLKLRVIPNPVYLESFSAFKANPIPMAFGELYSALETRTVDGQENPYTVILSNKFYEVQKFVSATNHTFTENIVLVSKIFWDKLTPAEQKMMQEAYAESRGYQKEQTVLQTQKALGELQAKGMQYNAVAPEELERLRKAVEPVVTKVSAALKPETVKLFNEELDRIRKTVK